MKLTWADIEAKEPCVEAVVWGKDKYNGKDSIEGIQLIRDLIADGKLEWANWMIK